MYSPRPLAPMPNTALAIALIGLLSWGCRSGPPPGRLLVLGIDGMDPQILRDVDDRGPDAPL